MIPKGARQSTMNINSFHGGQAEPEPDFDGLPSPCVPDSARMVIDVISGLAKADSGKFLKWTGDVHPW